MQRGKCKIVPYAVYIYAGDSTTVDQANKDIQTLIKSTNYQACNLSKFKQGSIISCPVHEELLGCCKA